jgi:hypothetical protein
MNLTRPAFLVAAFSLLISSHPLPAQTPAPWAPDKQFSADQVITTKSGMTINSKIYVDSGKIRTESDANGMNIVSIILPADKVMYNVMVEQKMVMKMPLSEERAKQAAAAAGGSSDAKFELVGPDTVDGTPCIKYKMTSAQNAKTFFWWINAATKAPVKMTSDDGAFTLSWKNYKTGAQDPALFQPPAGYPVMDMPGGMGMPGGGAPGAQ